MIAVSTQVSRLFTAHQPSDFINSHRIKNNSNELDWKNQCNKCKIYQHTTKTGKYRFVSVENPSRCFILSTSSQGNVKISRNTNITDFSATGGSTCLSSEGQGVVLQEQASSGSQVTSRLNVHIPMMNFIFSDHTTHLGYTMYHRGQPHCTIIQQKSVCSHLVLFSVRGQGSARSKYSSSRMTGRLPGAV